MEHASVARPLEVAVLTEGAVRLRPWRDDESSRVVQAVTDPRTLQFLPELPDPYGPEDAAAYLHRTREWASRGEQVVWCVADVGTDLALGSISLSDLSDRVSSAQVGYWTHPDARGRGVMSAALRLVLRHALTPVDEGGLGLRRAWLRAAGTNAASLHVARAAGMTEVGRDRQGETLRDGTVDDMVRFDILTGELEGR